MRACAALALLLLSLPASAVGVGDTVYAKNLTPSARFPDADDKGPVFDEEARLVVVFVEGDKLRVRGDEDAFGWVDASAVTDVGPAFDDAALQEALKNLDLGGLQMDGGGAGASP